MFEVLGIEETKVSLIEERMLEEKVVFRVEVINLILFELFWCTGGIFGWGCFMDY